jgi:hypothetical protein
MRRLPVLERIIISRCYNFRLPEDVHLLQSLRVLKLEGYGGEELPPSFVLVPKLKVLTVRMGNLLQLPRNIGLMSSLRKVVLRGVAWSKDCDLMFLTTADSCNGWH